MPNRVKELREAAGQTQDDVAKAWNVTRQTISSIENGRYLPLLPLAFRIARHFNTTVEEVFNDIA